MRPLSKLLANALNPLVKQFVPAHLNSTTEFISSLKLLQPPAACNFGSIDVTNLYGSIPLFDTDTHPGLITIATKFFNDFKASSFLSDISAKDFSKLLKICLLEDCYLFQGKCFTQNSGIAMGNCAAPPLAIIFMHYIETLIKNQCEGIIFWRRYIDDVFLITSNNLLSILHIANSIHPNIKFTLETPADNKLAFFDTLVSFNIQNISFDFQLFI